MSDEEFLTVKDKLHIKQKSDVKVKRKPLIPLRKEEIIGVTAAYISFCVAVSRNTLSKSNKRKEMKMRD